MAIGTIPYSCWSIDLVSAICAVFPWSHDEVLQLTACAGFMYAMTAERIRWQRIEDARLAASFPHMQESGRSWLLSQINHKLSGPGIVPRFEELLSDEEREAARRANEERDAAFEQFRALGLLVGTNGVAVGGSILRGG